MSKVPERVLVYENPDGSVRLCYIDDKYLARQRARGLSDAQIDDAVAADYEAKAAATQADWNATRVASIASSAVAKAPYRRAWRYAAGAVAPDMTEAVKERMQEIRAVRNALLRDSDARIAWELERTGSIPANVRAWRKALRDLPADISADIAAISTPEDLVNYEPTYPQEPA